MLKKVIGLVAAVCLMAVSMTALAKDVKKKNKTPYQRKQIMVLKGASIFGAVLGPKGMLIQPGKKYTGPSLIDYRYDFVDKMVAVPRDL